MDAACKAARIALLTKIGQEVEKELLNQHTKAGGDPKEIIFRQDKIPALVDDYELHLEDYRERHIGQGKLVDGDKIAAFTGVLIMRYWLFESQTGEVNTEFSSLANETFAVRISQLFCKHKSFIPLDYVMFTHCFSECYEHDDCMNTWTVAAMAQQLRKGSVKELAFAD